MVEGCGFAMTEAAIERVDSRLGVQVWPRVKATGTKAPPPPAADDDDVDARLDALPSEGPARGKRASAPRARGGVSAVPVSGEKNRARAPPKSSSIQKERDIFQPD
jgi:hypothetical protein